MSTDELTRAPHVDLPAEPVRVAERPLVRAALLVVGLVVVVALPWWVYPPVAVDILAWGLFAVSVDLLLGFTGLLSFGHAAFWGASAYATGLVAIHSGPAVPGGDRRRGRRRDAARRADRLPGGAPHRHLLRHGDPGLRPDALLRGQPVASGHRR